MVGERWPVVLLVASVEAAGMNKIPTIVAAVLTNRLGLSAQTPIMHAISPKRAAMDGLGPLLSPAEIDGVVTKDADYMLVAECWAPSL